jgi:hypothetical protein
MSSSVMTDQPFFTLHALSILLFVTGLSTGRRRWLVGAGLSAGIAAYLRSVGQLWPFVFVFIALLWPVRNPQATRLSNLRRSLWTSGLLLLMILAWSTFNDHKFGVFTFNRNGVRAATLYWTARAVATLTEGETVLSVRDRWAAEDRQLYGRRTPTHEESYYRDRHRVLTHLKQHPVPMARTFLTNVHDNVRAANYFPREQIPAHAGLWQMLIRASHRWFNYAILAAALGGLFLLMRDGNREAWVVLGVTFAYFTLITGFSFWQGSRLHFPAEMAWSTLVACVLVRVAAVASRRLGMVTARDRVPGSSKTPA